MKLTFEDEEITFEVRDPVALEERHCGDLGWLFARVLRVCGGRLDHVVATIAADLDENFVSIDDPGIDEARGRLVQAARDLKAAWERHDERFFGEREGE